MNEQPSAGSQTDPLTPAGRTSTTPAETPPAASPTDSAASPLAVEARSAEPASVEEGEWEEDDLEPAAPGETSPGEADNQVVRMRRRKRQPKADAEELRLRGRRALCKSIVDIAPDMLKTVKLRVLGRYLESIRGLEDDDLTNVLKHNTVQRRDAQIDVSPYSALGVEERAPQQRRSGVLRRQPATAFAVTSISRPLR